MRCTWVVLRNSRSFAAYTRPVWPTWCWWSIHPASTAARGADVGLGDRELGRLRTFVSTIFAPERP